MISYIDKMCNTIVNIICKQDSYKKLKHMSFYSSNNHLPNTNHAWIFTSMYEKKKKHWFSAVNNMFYLTNNYCGGTVNISAPCSVMSTVCSH